MEYQRRFLLSAPPVDLSRRRSITVRQAYWALGDGWVLRLRRTGDEAHDQDEVAIKGPRFGAGRHEFEFPMHATRTAQPHGELKAAAADLYRASKGHNVVKTRWEYIDDDGFRWQIDQFHLENTGLWVAELELVDPIFLSEFQAPTWLGEEITNDNRYNNENLAFRPYSSWDHA